MNQANALASFDNDITVPPTSTSMRKEVAFVDTAVADWQALAAGIRPGVEIVLLDGSRDGLVQMAEWAQSHSGYDAIHVLSHGAEAVLQLGTQRIDPTSLADAGVQAQLATLGQVLTADGDLLLYGCSLAGSEAGQAFIAKLAAASGADVAASDNPTGASWLGGDWKLEKTNGIIEAENGLMETDTGFAGILADTDLTGTYTLNATGAADVFVIQAPGTAVVDGYNEPDNDFNGASQDSYYMINGFDPTADKISVVSWGKTNATVGITIEGNTNGYSDFYNGWANSAQFKIYVSPGYITASGFTSLGFSVIPANAVVTDAANNPVGGDTTGTLVFLADATPNWNLHAIFLPGVTSTSLSSANFIIEAPTGPTVTDAKISITSSPSGTGGTYKIGDTVTATWNNTAGGDNQSGISGVTMNFSAFGGGTAVAATESSGTWTASYILVAGSVDGANKNVSVTATNGSGSTTTADTSNLTVDNQAPTVSDARIAISGASGSGGAYKIGDTVTATWNNTAGGDNNSDTISGVTVDFSAFGGGAAVAASNSGGTWTATYTLVAGAIDGTNKNVSVTATDNAGNTTITADTSNATVDNVAPTVSDSKISISGASGSGGAYKIGDTITATWNNTAGGDNNSDTISGVTVDFSQFGGGAAVAASNSGGTWTATYTLVAGAINGTANRNVSVTTTDNAGNTTTTADSTNATVDNVAPTQTNSTLSFSADTGSSGSDFITQTAAQTISGTLSGVTATGDIVQVSLNDGSTWATATNTIGQNSWSLAGQTLTASNTLRVRVTDAAGNSGTVASQAYVLDTTAPVVSAVSIPNSTMKVGDVVTATISVSDDGGSVYTLGSSTIGGFTLGGLTRTNSTTYTAQFTVSEGGTDVAAGSNIPVSVVLSDPAGNSNSAYTTAIAQAGDAINAHTPSDIALSSSSIATIAGSNAVVGALSSTDATSGDTFTYSLVAGSGGTDNASFNINGSDLRANDAGALTAGNSYSVRIRTTDAAGNTFDEAFSINAVVGPAIASASYDAASGVLVVTGSLMEAKTGAANDIAVNKLTLTGEGGATYTLTSNDVEITSATEFSVTLNATDRAALNLILNKNGTTSTSGTTFNLAAADDWNANVTTGNTADASNAVTTSNVAVPAITSATYDHAGNVMVVTGTGFLPKAGASNDIDLTRLTFSGEGGATYTLTDTTGVEISSGTSFSVTLSGADLTNVEALLNKDGSAAVSGATYNLSAAASWNRGDASGGSDTSNAITVSNYAAPTLTSATFDASSNVLTVTGSNLVSKSGATNDVTVSLLTLVGEGGSHALTSADVEISNATTFAITLNAADQLVVRGLLNKNGTASASATTYNLAAAEDWMAGSAAATVIADLTGNGITVSNVPTPTITSATYDADSGILSVTGTNLFKKVGAANDIDISMLTFTGGTANATYTLTSTSDVEITSATSFSITLAGADKTGVDALLDQLGTQSSGGSTYNLAAADDWLTGADAAANIADASNAITVTINPKITSATYNAATGVLLVTGSNIQANAAGADIDATKFTLTGEGGATHTLTDTANVERDSATQFTLTLSATDQAAIQQILNQNGTTSTGATTYNLAAADDWCTQVTAGDTADATGNGITVSNVAAPTITSATYNAATGVLLVSGTGLLKKSGATNDIDVSKLTLAGEGGASRTLTSSSVEISSGTTFSVTLNAADLAAVNQILNKAGTTATGGATYNLAAAEDWAAGAAAAVTVADLTGNGITVSNPTTPSITSATYDAATGALVVSGTGLLSLSGASNDIVANKFTLTGQAGGTYTLTDTANVELSSATAFTLTLSTTDKAGVAALLNKAGLAANDNTAYNLAAAEDWAAGAALAVNVADLTGNAVTVTLPSANSGGSAPPPAPTTTVDGATLSTGSTTTSDGRVLETLSIAPVPSNRQDTVGISERADVALFYGDAARNIPATTVSLPAGVGLTTTGNRTPASNEAALLTLTGLIQQTGNNQEANQPNMVTGGEAFLDALNSAASQGPLIINAVTLTSTSNTAAGREAITLRGSPAPVGSGGAPVEAIVIDTRQLPPGSILELQDIEFAVIIGDHVTVRGGDGQNIVFAGAGSQNIVLGADDDVLHGGDGDDTVGSKGGNDILYGDAGNNLLVGGIGNDILYGGDGDDILQGGASDAGSWSFGLNAAGALVARFVPTDVDLADSHGGQFVGQWTRPDDQRGLVDNRLGLIEHNHQTLADLALLFNALLGQRPEAAALNAAANEVFSAQLSPTATARLAYAYWLAQQPASAPAAPLETQVRALITRVWGQASDAEVAIGSDYLQHGGDWGAALLFLARHANNRNDLQDADGIMQLTAPLLLNQTGWSANAGDDQLFGGAGNDLLVGGLGNKLLDGGTGTDMVALVGAPWNYTLGLQEVLSGTVDLVLHNVHSGDINLLRGIELLAIGGQIHALKTTLPFNASGESAPLGDCLRLIGNAELQGMGLPASWMG